MAFRPDYVCRDCTMKGLLICVLLIAAGSVSRSQKVSNDALKIKGPKNVVHNPLLIPTQTKRGTRPIRNGSATSLVNFTNNDVVNNVGLPTKTKKGKIPDKLSAAIRELYSKFNKTDQQNKTDYRSNVPLEFTSPRIKEGNGKGNKGGTNHRSDKGPVSHNSYANQIAMNEETTTIHKERPGLGLLHVETKGTFGTNGQQSTVHIHKQNENNYTKKSNPSEHGTHCHGHPHAHNTVIIQNKTSRNITYQNNIQQPTVREHKTYIPLANMTSALNITKPPRNNSEYVLLHGRKTTVNSSSKVKEYKSNFKYGSNSDNKDPIYSINSNSTQFSHKSSQNMPADGTSSYSSVKQTGNIKEKNETKIHVKNTTKKESKLKGILNINHTNNNTNTGYINNIEISYHNETNQKHDKEVNESAHVHDQDKYKNENTSYKVVNYKKISYEKFKSSFDLKDHSAERATFKTVENSPAKDFAQIRDLYKADNKPVKGSHTIVTYPLNSTGESSTTHQYGNNGIFQWNFTTNGSQVFNSQDLRIKHPSGRTGQSHDSTGSAMHKIILPNANKRKNKSLQTSKLFPDGRADSNKRSEPVNKRHDTMHSVIRAKLTQSDQIQKYKLDNDRPVVANDGLARNSKIRHTKFTEHTEKFRGDNKDNYNFHESYPMIASNETQYNTDKRKLAESQSKGKDNIHVNKHLSNFRSNIGNKTTTENHISESKNDIANNPTLYRGQEKSSGANTGLHKKHTVSAQMNLISLGHKEKNSNEPINREENYEPKTKTIHFSSTMLKSGSSPKASVGNIPIRNDNNEKRKKDPSKEVHETDISTQERYDTTGKDYSIGSLTSDVYRSNDTIKRKPIELNLNEVDTMYLHTKRSELESHDGTHNIGGNYSRSQINDHETLPNVAMINGNTSPVKQKKYHDVKSSTIVDLISPKKLKVPKQLNLHSFGHKTRHSVDIIDKKETSEQIPTETLNSSTFLKSGLLPKISVGKMSIRNSSYAGLHSSVEKQTTRHKALVILNKLLKERTHKHLTESKRRIIHPPILVRPYNTDKMEKSEFVDLPETDTSAQTQYHITDKKPPLKQLKTAGLTPLDFIGKNEGLHTSEMYTSNDTIKRRIVGSTDLHPKQFKIKSKDGTYSRNKTIVNGTVPNEEMLNENDSRMMQTNYQNKPNNASSYSKKVTSRYTHPNSSLIKITNGKHTQEHNGKSNNYTVGTVNKVEALNYLKNVANESDNLVNKSSSNVYGISHRQLNASTLNNSLADAQKKAKPNKYNSIIRKPSQRVSHHSNTVLKSGPPPKTYKLPAGKGISNNSYKGLPPSSTRKGKAPNTLLHKSSRQDKNVKHLVKVQRRIIHPPILVRPTKERELKKLDNKQIQYMSKKQVSSKSRKEQEIGTNDSVSGKNVLKIRDAANDSRGQQTKYVNSIRDVASDLGGHQRTLVKVNSDVANDSGGHQRKYVKTVSDVANISGGHQHKYTNTNSDVTNDSGSQQRKYVKTTSNVANDSGGQQRKYVETNSKGANDSGSQQRKYDKTISDVTNDSGNQQRKYVKSNNDVANESDGHQHKYAITNSDVNNDSGDQKGKYVKTNSDVTNDSGGQQRKNVNSNNDVANDSGSHQQKYVKTNSDVTNDSVGHQQKYVKTNSDVTSDSGIQQRKYVKTNSDVTNDSGGQQRKYVKTNSDVTNNSGSQQPKYVKTNSDGANESGGNQPKYVKTNNDVTNDSVGHQQKYVKTNSDVTNDSGIQQRKYVKTNSDVTNDSGGQQRKYGKTNSDVTNNSGIQQRKYVKTNSDGASESGGHQQKYVKTNSDVTNDSGGQQRKYVKTNSDVTNNSGIQQRKYVKTNSDGASESGGHQQKYVKTNSDVTNDSGGQQRKYVKTNSDGANDSGGQQEKYIKTNSDVTNDSGSPKRKHVKTNSDVTIDSGIQQRKYVKTNSDVTNDSGGQQRKYVKTNSDVTIDSGGHQQKYVKTKSDVTNDSGIQQRKYVKTNSDGASESGGHQHKYVKTNIDVTYDSVGHQQKYVKTNSDVTNDPGSQQRKYVKTNSDVTNDSDGQQRKYVKTNSDVTNDSGSQQRTYVKTNSDVTNVSGSQQRTYVKTNSDVTNDSGSQQRTYVKTNSDVTNVSGSQQHKYVKTNSDVTNDSAGQQRKYVKTNSDGANDSAGKQHKYVKTNGDGANDSAGQQRKYLKTNSDGANDSGGQQRKYVKTNSDVANNSGGHQQNYVKTINDVSNNSGGHQSTILKSGLPPNTYKLPTGKGIISNIVQGLPPSSTRKGKAPFTLLDKSSSQDKKIKPLVKSQRKIVHPPILVRPTKGKELNRLNNNNLHEVSKMRVSSNTRREQQIDIKDPVSRTTVLALNDVANESSGKQQNYVQTISDVANESNGHQRNYVKTISDVSNNSGGHQSTILKSGPPPKTYKLPTGKGIISNSVQGLAPSSTRKGKAPITLLNKSSSQDQKIKPLVKSLRKIVHPPILVRPTKGNDLNRLKNNNLHDVSKMGVSSNTRKDLQKDTKYPVSRKTIHEMNDVAMDSSGQQRNYVKPISDGANNPSGHQQIYVKTISDVANESGGHKRKYVKTISDVANKPNGHQQKYVKTISDVANDPSGHQRKHVKTISDGTNDSGGPQQEYVKTISDVANGSGDQQRKYVKTINDAKGDSNNTKYVSPSVSFVNEMIDTLSKYIAHNHQQQGMHEETFGSGKNGFSEAIENQYPNDNRQRYRDTNMNRNGDKYNQGRTVNNNMLYVEEPITNPISMAMNNGAARSNDHNYVGVNTRNNESGGKGVKNAAPHTSNDQNPSTKTSSHDWRLNTDNISEYPGDGGKHLVDCSSGPVCGDNDVSYMSPCNIPTGIMKKCDGFCPCTSLTSYQNGSPVEQNRELPSSLLSLATKIVGQRRQRVQTPYPEGTLSILPFAPTFSINQQGNPYIGTDTTSSISALSGESMPTSSQHTDMFDNGSSAIEHAIPNVLDRCAHCERTVQPVCGVNGQTFDNECLQICSDVPMECEGACPCEIDDPPNNVGTTAEYISNSVRLEDFARGTVSQNSSQSSGIPFEKDNSDANCVCQDIGKPVCSTEGDEFKSACDATCRGKVIACFSTCPCQG